jgi:transposase-like protein
MKSKTTKTRQELATEMGICPKILNRWLKKHQIEIPNGLISPIQQQKIKELLGFGDDV